MAERKWFEPIVCEDGFRMSVQASESNYCSPRNNEGPWMSVEVGMPSHSESLILEWAEDKDDPTGTVYGWVPADVVLEVVDKHGGWKAGELPALWLGN